MVEATIKYSNQIALHWAVWNENGGLFDLLLKNAADINAKNIDGETALHYAARYNHGVLQQPLDKGAYIGV